MCFALKKTVFIVFVQQNFVLKIVIAYLCYRLDGQVLAKIFTAIYSLHYIIPQFS